jgi:DNA polymerase III subunit gamma/tau
MTYYLKYRPQNVSELDLDGVRKSLGEIIKSGRFPHAFLFSGPRGAGKTSTARILAKVLNCESPKDGEPCNECVTCLSITKGSSLDVIEIDAASNRGVDDMRQLRDTVKLAPAGSQKKVYIIDEAHMLTTEAANALLKTLEEPPSHAVFVLATTEPHKLLDTIRSRCTAITFYKGGKEEITRSLQKIVDGEKLEIEKEALEEIAKGVDGSFREAHKILEQLSFSGEKITRESVKKVLSGVSTSPVKLLTLLGKKDLPGSLEEIDLLVKNGVQLRVFTTEAVSILRQLLLKKAGIESQVEDIEGLNTSQEITTLLELLSESYRQYPTAVIPQLPLELVVFKWVNQSQIGIVQIPNITKVAQKAEEIVKQVVNSKEDKKDTAPISEISLPEDISQAAVVEASAPIIASNISDVELENLWREIMKQTKPQNTSLEALLRACKLNGFDGQVLTVEVFYKFHKDKLEQTVYRELVEKIAAEILGTTKLRMLCVLSNTRKKAADVVNVAAVPSTGEDISQLAEQIFGGDGKVH